MEGSFPLQIWKGSNLQNFVSIEGIERVGFAKSGMWRTWFLVLPWTISTGFRKDSCGEERFCSARRFQPRCIWWWVPKTILWELAVSFENSVFSARFLPYFLGRPWYVKSYVRPNIDFVLCSQSIVRIKVKKELHPRMKRSRKPTSKRLFRIKNLESSRTRRLKRWIRNGQILRKRVLCGR